MLDPSTSTLVEEFLENREYGLASDLIVEGLKDAQTLRPQRAFKDLARAREMMGLNNSRECE